MDERGYLLDLTEKTEKSEPHKPKARKRKRPNRIRALITCLVVLVLVSVYGVVLAANLNAAKKHLFSGRDNLQSAYAEAEKAEFEKAAQHFEQAKTDFFSANRTLNNPSIKMLSVVPIVNKNVLAIRKITSAGLEITLAGESFMQASMLFPQEQGKIDFSFSNGGIDLGPFIAARSHVNQANLHALMAIAEYDKIPNRFLIASLQKAKEELGEQLPKFKSLATNTRQAFETIPDILGANGKRRYFLAVQNNAELRATGGLIGNYGVITVENGKFALEAFDEIHKLQRKDQPAVDAPQDFASRYGRFKGNSMWINANMSPDFPTVSRVLIDLYRSVTGVKLDGVISVDPIGLKYLLAATGPVNLPEEAINVDAGNVVDWTLISAYEKYEERGERKDFLADVAKAVWECVITGQIEDKSKFMEQIKLALSEKHMALFSIHEQEQKLAESLGYAGATIPTSNDYLQVIMQNHGGNKVDVYLHEQIEYTVTLRPDGSARADVSVKIINKTPTSGLSEYVSGGHPLGVKGGYSNTWLNIYVPKGVQLLSAKEGGKDSEIEVGFEKDKMVFSQYVKIAPGSSRTVNFTYELPYVLVFNGDEINYALDWQSQPVINKPDATLNIIAPEGFEFSKLPEGFIKKGRRVSYNGVLKKDERFEVVFADNR